MEKIELCLPGLPAGATIHIVGSTIGWGLGLEYPSPLDEEGETVLIFDPKSIGVDFKHFVLCDVNERQQVLDAIKNGGYDVTGAGDQYEEKWRIWFLLTDYLTFGDGVYKNNTFAG